MTFIVEAKHSVAEIGGVDKVRLPLDFVTINKTLAGVSTRLRLCRSEELLSTGAPAYKMNGPWEQEYEQ